MAYNTCPRCGSRSADSVTWTWWGGFIGPMLLSHVRCRKCGTEFNRNTGRSNNTAITLMLVIPLVLVCPLVCVGFIIGFIGSLPGDGPPKKPVKNQVQAPPIAPPKPPPEDHWAFLDKSVKDGLAKDSDIVGLPGDGTFRELYSEGAMLVGFNIGFREIDARNRVMTALQPVYFGRTAEGGVGEIDGKWVGRPPANPYPVRTGGFVVKAVGVRGRTHIEAIHTEVLRFDYRGVGLEKNVREFRSWQGNGSEDKYTTVDSGGRLTIGVFGRLNAQGEPCAIGLITVPGK